MDASVYLLVNARGEVRARKRPVRPGKGESEIGLRLHIDDAYLERGVPTILVNIDSGGPILLSLTPELTVIEPETPPEPEPEDDQAAEAVAEFDDESDDETLAKAA